MYKSYEFIFDDLPSSMFGLYICDFAGSSHSDNSFGNVADIVETRVPGRVRPLHYGVDYNKTPLSFSLIFGSDKELDRWEMQEIAQWLTGHQHYKWLSIEQPDLADVQFRCLITELTPISVGWIPYAFEAQVTCDCPYAYGYPFEETHVITDGDTIRIFNHGTAREYCRPKFTFIPQGSKSLSIKNESDKDRTFALTLPTSGNIEVYVDNENCIMEEKVYGYDLYDGFNDIFLRLVPGENILTFAGSGTITISGRYYYNVGA